MITKDTKYVDFLGNERTETMHFNLTQVELVEMGMDLPDDIKEEVGGDPSNITEETAINLMVKLGEKGIMAFLKTVILKSYGVVSEDGRRFEKSEQISKEFSETIAFGNLMMELLADDEAAANFINSLIPSAVADKVPAIQNKQ